MTLQKTGEVSRLPYFVLLPLGMNVYGTGTHPYDSVVDLFRLFL